MSEARHRAGSVESGPERTCVGCRRRASRYALLRFVADDRGHLRLDLEQRASGRGGYVCPARTCLELALGRGFARSLRRRLATVDLLRFSSQTRAALEEAARELLDQARQDGRARLLDDEVTEPRARERLRRLRDQADRLSIAARVAPAGDGVAG